MDKLIYIGPDLIFNFYKKNNSNLYSVFVKSAGIKLELLVEFICTVENKPCAVTECTMLLSVCNITHAPLGIEALNKAINCLIVNSKLAGEVCCTAFLNDFLDSEF